MADEEIGGYRFRDPALLATALTHSSYAHEHPDERLDDFERLEFLGDAVVDLVAADLLFRSSPEAPEGVLTPMRARLVSGPPLAQIARKLGLTERARVGVGENETGGRDRVGFGAGLYEAVVGAVYMDGGFEAAKDFVVRSMAETIAAAEATPWQSPKTTLQHLALSKHMELPRYTLVEAVGPSHGPEFVFEVRSGDVVATGRGMTKQSAQEAAAAAMIELIRD